MAYAPEIDRQASAILRRIAWVARRPMTSVLEELVFLAAEVVDPGKVCPACRDPSQCALCLLAPRPVPARADLVKLLKHR